VITSAGALGLSEPLDADDSGVVPEPAGTTLRDVERGHILRILAARNWRIEGRQGAADILGLKPSTLRSLMHRLNIQRTDVPRSGATGRDRARREQRLAHTGS
jgi:transcriptional regulator with GAF, ATPase, and Fis domain